MTTIRTQIAIIGAGPAGLMLGHLLDRAGIDSVILENRARDHVIQRVRAGVLEQGTVDVLTETGVGGRLSREGLRHEGVQIAFRRRRHRVDLSGPTGGRAITIYGQNEIVTDLIDARVGSGRPLFFDCGHVTPVDPAGDRPRVRFVHAGAERTIECDFIAGCDGSHGVSRPAIPAGVLRVHERTYPFAWLGILAEAVPASDELVYSLHERGFALFSMRSPSITRLYLQCAPDEDLDAWPDDRVWSELRLRLSTDDGWAPGEGPVLQKSVTAMRAMVAEPMRWGRLFLAGDAAHIVPPTGAKGLNLAVADVTALARAFRAFYATGDETGLDRYSDRALARVWRAQRFSWWMTTTLHRTFDGEFDYLRQLAELDYLFGSPAGTAGFAESYTGPPLERQV